MMTASHDFSLDTLPALLDLAKSLSLYAVITPAAADCINEAIEIAPFDTAPGTPVDLWGPNWTIYHRSADDTQGIAADDDGEIMVADIPPYILNNPRTNETLWFDEPREALLEIARRRAAHQFDCPPSNPFG